jgi:amino acid adenylation domain-containing protein
MTGRFDVVRNGEDQWSVWPAGREAPRGWRPTGTTAGVEECLAEIAVRWTDPRPASLRRRLDGPLPTPVPAPAERFGPPDLPLTSRAAEARAEEEQQHTVDRDAWTAIAGAAVAHGVEPAAVPVAVFAEVIARWSAGLPFALCWSDAADPAPRLLPVVDDDTVAARAGRLADRLTGSLDDAGEWPVAVTDAGPDGDGPILAPPGSVLHLSFSMPATGPDGLRLRLLSRAGQLPDGFARDVFGALVRTLGELRDDPSGWDRADLVTLPPEQLARQEAANATTRPVPDGLLHTALGRHAAERPDAPAVLTSGRTLTYGELAVRVNRLGHRLRELGVRPDTLVGVVMEKGWEHVVALHGVLAAGAAYLPIDPALPPARLAHLIDHGRIGVVLTQSRLDDTLTWPSSVRRLRVDRDVETGPAEPLIPAQTPGHLAYVIPTSGSTGSPKGVMVEHRGPLNALTDINRRFGVGPADRCFAISALQFDLSVYDHFGLILAGGALVVPDPSPRPDPAAWLRLAESAGVTVWNSVPVFLEMVVAQLEAERRETGLRALRLAILGGDFIPLHLPDRLRARNARVRIVNGGGPAESCVYSIMHEIGRVDPSWAAIPYGRPVANQRYHVVDERGRACPAWVPGELIIDSEVGLARGYWRDEEQTACRFRRSATGGRTYVTGDVGRYLPDGSIELMGRKDFQIKLQGVRIELGEIEATMTAHPAVAAAAVVAVAGRQREVAALHGFVVWRNDPDRLDDRDRLEELRGHLADRLPRAMVPARLSALAELPLTPNGKVDRLTLAGRRKEV